MSLQFARRFSAELTVEADIADKYGIENVSIRRVFANPAILGA
jgi:hypothetical protein